MKQDVTKIAVEVFDRFAKEYQDRFMDFDNYNDSFDLFCDSVPKEGAEVLEIACGPGNITRYLLKKRPDFRILCIDLAQGMIELAKINNPEAEFRIMDARDIRKLGKKYDAIMCGFCLPFLSKEEAGRLIADAADVLRPDGIFYLSTMEDDYEKSGFKTSGTGKELYFYYHTAEYLTGALSANGLEVIDLWRKDFPETDGSVTIDLLILARLKK